MKRPGTGISPTQIDKIIGKIAKKNLQDDYAIKFSDLNKMKKLNVLYVIMVGGVGSRLRSSLYFTEATSDR